MTEPVVIVGASHAGFQIAASLRQQGYDGGIKLIGDEPDLPYQRPPLSKDYLSGKIGFDLLLMRPDTFYKEHRIDFLPMNRVTTIDRADKKVRLASGDRLGYEHLVLATGARNRVPPLPGIELEGVCYLRDLAETSELRDRMAAAKEIVVIGAGFIGLEFAAVAGKLGKPVHIVELVDRVMARVASVHTSHFFEAAHRNAGVTFHFGAQITDIAGRDDRVTHVDLLDGTRLPADLVLVSIGVVPNTELAAEAGLEVANGIVVNDQLLTADLNISAIGDCASFPCLHFEAGRPARLESVQNATDHARCVADRLVGKPRPYTALPWFWSEQGPLRLQIAGLTTGHDATAVRGDIGKGEFSVFCYRGEHLLGIESINRPADHVQARRILAAGRNVTPQEAADMSFDLKAAAAAR